MSFNRTALPSAVATCSNACKQAKTDDDKLVSGARQRAKSLLAQPMCTPCQQQAKGIVGTTDEFQRYSKAIPGAHAAQDLNALGDKADTPITAPCLKRLPLNADNLNKALGINPKSPNAITDKDLRNDTTGYRAALYRSESDGKIIMVSRETQGHSLVDWKTNIENGEGKDTDQYKAARTFSRKLAGSGQNFDIAGYSKGGGLAQEAGLVSPNSNVYVFNSSGLNSASLSRTGTTDFNSLTARTSSFSSEGDFVTNLNNSNDQAGQLANARFLRSEFAGPTGWRAQVAKYDDRAAPIKITHMSPQNTYENASDFVQERDDFFEHIDKKIAQIQENPDGASLFPPVRASSFDTIPNSMSSFGRIAGAEKAGPNYGKLVQHQISNVVGPMEKQIDADREAMKSFLKACG